MNLDADSLLLDGMAVSGDCFYAALSNYYGEYAEAPPASPLGILRYNYKTSEKEYSMLFYGLYFRIAT